MELIRTLYLQALTTCVRRVLTSLDIPNETFTQDELWGAIVYGVKTVLTMQGEQRPVPPISIQTIPVQPVLRQRLTKFTTQFEITIEEVEQIYVKCGNSFEKTEIVLILMAMMFKADEEVLANYQTYIRAYAKDINVYRSKLQGNG